MATLLDEEFKHESLQDKESIVKYLNALSEGISGGSLLFGTDKKKVVLEPAGLLNFGVKAKRRGRKFKLQLNLSWMDGKENKEQKNDPLVIKPERNKR